MPLIPSFFEAKGKGEFSLLNLSLAIENPMLDISFKKDMSEEQRLDQWRDATAYFHELRHYHDLVGSVCGFHVLLEATALVDGFYGALKLHKGQRLRPPITVHNPDSQATRLYRSYRDFLKVVFGDLPTRAILRESTRYPVQTYRSDIPPVSTSYPLVPINSRDHHTGKSRERHIPVGLRALMEHTATEMQVFLASIGAGEDPLDPHDPEGRVRRAISFWASLFRSEFLPYTVVQLFASYAKHSASGMASPSFSSMTPRIGDILSIAQAAMDFSGYAVVKESSGSQWVFEHPGLVLAHLLSSWTEEKDFSDLVDMIDRVTKRIPVLKYGYSDFIKFYADSLEKGYRGVPSRLAPEAATHPLIYQLRDDLFVDHAALIKSKASDLEAWLLPPRYIESIPQLLAPPLQNGPGIHCFHRNRDQTIHLLWWIFLLAFTEGIAEGGEVVCPIFKQAPLLGRGLSFKDPEDPGLDTNCEPFITSHRCGRFHGSFLPTQPDCPFALVIRKTLEEFDLDFDFEETSDESA